MPQVDDLLRYLKDHDGSDLHLAAGLEPRIRAKGQLEAVEGWETVQEEGLLELLQPIANERHWAEYTETHDVDFAYGLEGVARFRANYFYQQNGPAAVFRIIPEEIISLKELKLPASVAKLSELTQGLVVVTGPTGSGKSTTLAAIVDKINREQNKHIVTIEDPVEFVHQNRESVMSHREVGEHSQGFAPALRAAVRQDADVVLVGEMRDRETIAMAITAAEMGMLVFGTLHTNGAAKTIDRIIDAFPASEQAQVRISLSESLAAVVSQLLLARAQRQGSCGRERNPASHPGPPEPDPRGQHPDDQLDHPVREGRRHAGHGRRPARTRPAGHHHAPGCLHEGPRQGALRSDGSGRLSRARLPIAVYGLPTWSRMFRPTCLL